MIIYPVLLNRKFCQQDIRKKTRSFQIITQKTGDTVNNSHWTNCAYPGCNNQFPDTTPATMCGSHRKYDLHPADNLTPSSGGSANPEKGFFEEGETAMFSNLNLPPFKANTNGIARPKPGPDVAACIAPAATTIARPVNWGEGQALEIEEGVWHIAQDAEGDSYPNQEFATFYTTSGTLDTSDPRAAFLKKFWADRGHNVEIVLARKVRHAVVLGVVTDEAAGQTYTNHEGVTEMSEGGLILESPDDSNARWFITRKVFDKKYLGIEPAAT